MKSATQLSRRQFLARGVALFGLALTTSAAVAAPVRRKKTSMTIYRLTRRGRKAPKALKLNCANLRFATPFEAEKHRLGSWDKSRVVPLTVSRDEYYRLFFQRTARGASKFSPVADLRKIK